MGCLEEALLLKMLLWLAPLATPTAEEILPGVGTDLRAEVVLLRALDLNEMAEAVLPGALDLIESAEEVLPKGAVDLAVPATLEVLVPLLETLAV